jgi:hypothetical protein
MGAKERAAVKREERQAVRERLAELRRELRDARARRKGALLDAKERCRAERLAAGERARAMRLRATEELRGAMQSERAVARATCAGRLREARAIKEDMARTRAVLHAERRLQRDLRLAAHADRLRRKEAPGIGRRGESDDEVLANVPSELAPLFDRVKRSIKATPRMSRTEAFLKYAETHPGEVLLTTRDPSHLAVSGLEREHRETAASLNPFEARKTARIERMQERAQRLLAASEGAHASARAISEHIPMGQPILVDHHSERRHRRDLDRIQRGFSKSIELRNEAESLRLRADRAARSGAVSSDDPDAVAKLRAKLEGLERDRARMVSANKAVRSAKPREALAALGFSESMTTKALTPDPIGNIGFPAYALRNAAGETARLRKRIAELEARATGPTAAAIDLPGARIEENENRVRIVFDAKPADSVRSALKSAGFRWSPTSGAWQRNASNAAWYEAKRILNVDAPAGMAGARREKPANQNAVTAGGPRPEEVERIRALEQRPQPKVKGEGLDTTQIAARIREAIKGEVRSGALPKANYSVRTDKYSMGSSITVVASKLPFEVINPAAFIVERGANWVSFDRDHHRSRFTHAAQEVEQTLNAIIGAYHWDKSDSMTDLYHERFAKHVEVKEDDGAWRRIEAAKVADARAAEGRG